MSKIQVNEIVNHFDNGAPDCPRGLTVTGVSTFSGNVSIGGTLTYEDVTNIDSVGIITAQSGIRVPGGSVGIGTAIGGIPLHIFNSVSTVKIRIDGDSNDAIMSFANSGSGIGAIGIAAGAITSGGATNIGLQSNNDLLFASGGISERMRIDSSGRLLVGTSSVRNAGTAIQTTRSPLYFIEGAGANAYSLFTGILGRADLNGPNITLAKTRSNSTGDNTIVQNDDVLGQFFFAGADGTDLNSIGASIQAEVDGTPGVDDMPGRLVFSTTADGASSPSERLRIGSEGLISTPASSVGPTNVNKGFHHGTVTQAVGMTMKTLGYGSGTSNFDTGVSVNAGNAGAVALLFATRNTSNGTSTNGGIYIAHFYYDGNNTPAVTFLGGSNWITSWSQTASNTLQANWSGNSNFTFSMMMCQ